MSSPRGPGWQLQGSEAGRTGPAAAPLTLPHPFIFSIYSFCIYLCDTMCQHCSG